MTHGLRGNVLSNWQQDLSQKDNLNENCDCSKVINIGTLFGISVKTKIHNSTQIMLSQRYSRNIGTILV